MLFEKSQNTPQFDFFIFHNKTNQAYA